MFEHPTVVGFHHQGMRARGSDPGDLIPKDVLILEKKEIGGQW